MQIMGGNMFILESPEADFLIYCIGISMILIALSPFMLAVTNLIKHTKKRDNQ